MATMYDLIPTPYAVRGKAVTEIRCPMLTPAAGNHELQHGRPRQVWIAGDDRAYGDVLEAVNAIEQHLGRFDDKSPVYVCRGDLDVCLVAVLLERLREAGSDADVMLARQIVRCTHSTKAVTRRDALDMKKERPGRPRAKPGVSAANRERKKTRAGAV